MNEPAPITTLAQLKEFLLQTFEIPPEQAHSHASRLLSLIGSSSPGMTSALEWQFLAKQEFGEKLPWRLDAEREQFRLEHALSRHTRPPLLSEFVLSHDRAGFRAALKQILLTERASDQDVETLKSVADPSTAPFGPNDEWKNQVVKFEAFIASIAAGLGGDPVVMARLDELLKRYLAELEPGSYHKVAVGLLILVAGGDEAAAPALRFALERAPIWSVRIACLYGLPESRSDGTYHLIDNFRRWLNQQDSTTVPAHLRYSLDNWKAFMSCLTKDGLYTLVGQDARWPVSPLADFSPLIDWAVDHNHTDWLANEFNWLRNHRSVDVIPVRNRMIERGVPAAVEFCLEQVKNARYEDDTHYEVIYNLQRLHPKPLPKRALDGCLEVLRHPCHPGKFEHRIDALNQLVEAAVEGRYAADEVRELVLELAQTDSDIDVRSAAIRKVPWAAPDKELETLASALGHKSSRVRDEASQTLSQG